MGAKLSSGRSGGRRRRAHAMMSEINVTPLVDVMLVLLIIFMVTAPLLTAGVSVDLPKVKAQAISQPDDAPLEISVDSRGGISMGKTTVRLDKLKSTLAAIAVEKPDRRVYIRADSRLDYGKVMEVMTVVNSSGFSKIALITDPASAQGR